MTILILFSLGTIWFNGLMKIGDCWQRLLNCRILAYISPDIRVDRPSSSCCLQSVKVIIEYFSFVMHNYVFPFIFLSLNCH